MLKKRIIPKILIQEKLLDEKKIITSVLSKSFSNYYLIGDPISQAKIFESQLADEFINFINSAKKINLDLASEYLLMATWLTYLKSKLLLPQDEEEEFKASELLLIDLDRKITDKTRLNFIEKLSKEVFMPLTVGGGIKSSSCISKLLNVGADKICI